MFGLILRILAASILFSNKEDARNFFYELRQTMLDLNGTPEESDMFDSLYGKVEQTLSDKKPEFENRGLKMISTLE
jgi:hypothetical protein